MKPWGARWNFGLFFKIEPTLRRTTFFVVAVELLQTNHHDSKFSLDCSISFEICRSGLCYPRRPLS